MAKKDDHTAVLLVGTDDRTAAMAAVGRAGDAHGAALLAQQAEEQRHAVLLQNVAAAPVQGALQVVVADDFDEPVAQTGDLLAARDLFQQLGQRHVGADVLQQVRDELGPPHGQVDQHVPQLRISLAGHKLDGALDVGLLVDDDLQRFAMLADH